MEQLSVSDIRKDYKKGSLELDSLQSDPFAQFKGWFEQAVNAQVNEPNAMVVSTFGLDQYPDARVVLLKHLDGQHLGFYTNYESQKGQQIAHNNRCSLLFFWPELERQVRIQGSLCKMNEEQSTQYFQSRPLGSQIGAWASPQSQPIASRSELEQRWQQYEQQFAQQNPLPKPAHWGGYLVSPHKFEFWQGRASRMHDRFVYTLIEQEHAPTSWKLERLAP